jgi:tight adherence protein C
MLKNNELADFLEAMALGLSAGLVLEEACAHASEMLPEGEFKVALIAEPTLQKLRELGDKLNNARFSGIVSIIIQAKKNGAPLHDMLVEQAEFLRSEHLWTLEQQAQTLGLRLLFPILLFIFPGIFILLVGSLYLQITAQGFLF